MALDDLGLPQLPNIGFPSDIMDGTQISPPEFQLTSSSRTPKFSLWIDEVDVTQKIESRLISLVLTDNRGLDADVLSLELSDHDGMLEIPNFYNKEGVKKGLVSVHLGWRGTPYVNKGLYQIDAIEHFGTPDVLKITAKSLDFSSKLFNQRSKTRNSETLEALIKEIAEENNLNYEISNALKNVNTKVWLQQDESDANLLTRIANEFDAFVTIKNRKLIFLKIGEKLSSTGKPLPSINIIRSSGDQHRYTIASQDKYDDVRAAYQDLAKGEKIWVSAETGEQVSEEPESNDKVYTVRQPIYKNKVAAVNKARSLLKKLKRGEAKLSIQLAFANPALLAESPVSVQGFKKQIDNNEWIAEKIIHSLNQSGFTTQVDCELRVQLELQQ